MLQWLVKKLIESRDERGIKSKVTANFYYENILGNLTSKPQEIQISNCNKIFNDNISTNNSLNFPFNPITQNKNKIEEFKENQKIISQKNNQNDSEEFNEKKKSNLDFLKIQENNFEQKYNIFNKGRIFKPMQNYEFDYNDPLRVYFNLIEYGMNKDITFQKNLIELLKKKGLVDDASLEKDSSKIIFFYFSLKIFLI